VLKGGSNWNSGPWFPGDLIKVFLPPPNFTALRQGGMPDDSGSFQGHFLKVGATQQGAIVLAESWYQDQK